MKKILVSLFTLLFCFNIFYVQNTFAIDESSIKKELIISKSYLNKTSKGRNYVKQIDAFIQKNENNKNNLEKLSKKINEILTTKNITNKTTLNVLIYMGNKIDLILIQMNQDDYQIDSFEGFIENISSDEEEIKQEKTIIETISPNDKKLIEDKITSLQLNLLNKSVSIIENLTKEFENLANYEEVGNFEVDFNMDNEETGLLKGSFKLNDYTSITSNFDSQFKSKVETSLETLIEGEDEVKLKLNGLIDFISKDGNLYLLLEKFNIIDDKGTEEIKDFLDKAKEIAKENKYIKYTDKETQASLEILKSLNPTALINESRQILSEPFITAYKKQGNRYLLKPTKYACDQIKELSNRFDPFNPKSCSNSQYEELLEELEEAGSFYAEILDNNKTKIGFVGNKNLGLEKNEFYIIFDNEKILELSYNIDAGTNGGLSLDYIDKSHLDFILRGDNEINIDLKSTLSDKNKFTKIDFSLKEESYYSASDINLKLENKKLTGDFKIHSLQYDWNTQEKTERERITGTIVGKTDFNHELSQLEINYSGVKDSKEYLNGKLYISNSEFSFENKTEDKMSKSNILISGELDRNKTLNSGDIEISISTKERLGYDPETYKSNYSENYSEVFNLDISINNKNISGTTIVSEKGEEVMKITHSGNFNTDKFKLDNKFEFSEGLYPLKGYSADARNSKRTSDLGSIISKITIELVRGSSLELFTDGDYVDYIQLNMKEEYFLDPDGTPYQIRIKGDKYQLMAKLEDGKGNRIAKIMGTSKEDLFIINGKTITDGDIVEKGEPEEAKEAILNFNIDIDTSNNKNNIELFLNALYGDKEIFSLLIRNIGTKVFKKTEIKAPTNTIDYKEVFDIPERNYYY